MGSCTNTRNFDTGQIDATNRQLLHSSRPQIDMKTTRRITMRYTIYIETLRVKRLYHLIAYFEIIEAMKDDLPDVPVVFISSVTGQGITELKDVLWRELNDEENRVMTLTHRNLDERHRVEEEDNFDTGLERDESGDESGDDNFEEEDW